MADTTSIDLVALCSQDTPLQRTASTGGGEYHGPCPFCGGKDRFYVQVNPHGKGARWFCRQCSPMGKDAIAYVQRQSNVSFKEALAILGLEGQPQRPLKKSQVLRPANAPSEMRNDYIALNDPAWQQAAYEFSVQSYKNLHRTKAGRQQIDEYLISQRMLTEEVIQLYGLGYNPTDIHMNWGSVKVWLPSGIVIPWRYEGTFYTVKIRSWHGNYAQPSGNASGLYYGINGSIASIQPNSIVVVTEGEFDAMVIRAHTAHLELPLVTVATGSTAGAHALRWVMDIAAAKQVFIAFDNDENGAGDKGADWWLGQPALQDKVFRLRPVGAKDATDMARLGHNLADWVMSTLSQELLK